RRGGGGDEEGIQLVAGPQHERVAGPRSVSGREALVRRELVRLGAECGDLFRVEDTRNQHAAFAKEFLQDRSHLPPNSTGRYDTLHRECCRITSVNCVLKGPLPPGVSAAAARLLSRRVRRRRGEFEKYERRLHIAIVSLQSLIKGREMGER